MLKCAFNFQDPRGACFLCCGGTFSTKVYLAIACFLYASEEEYVVDSWWLFKYVWIYQSYSDFLCRLSIGFGTHWWWYLHLILQLAWNWRGGGTRPYLFSLWICFIHFVFSFSCFASFLWEKLFHCREKVPTCIVLYCIVLKSKKIVLCTIVTFVLCTIVTFVCCLYNITIVLVL
jgi:hypothetical protein